MSESDSESRPTATRGHGPPLRVWIGLVSLLGAFVVVYSLLSQLRYQEFFAGNWDLGLNMQLLWTNTHGHLLFETADYEIALANSFLYVHPTYIAIPLSYAYLAAPSATTLFVLQALAIAASGVPIFLSARERHLPDWAILCGVGLYLSSFPILSALLFDFHWEAFIPVELLSTYYLWNRGRYWWALLPAALGLLTLEVFPVLLAGLLLYFAYPRFFAVVRARGPVLARLRSEWSRSAPLVGLLLFAVVGYLVVRALLPLVLPAITGAAPVFPPPAPGVYFLGVYWWGISAATVAPRLLYWLLLFAAFGFLPLLFRQRLLILTIPWFLYSVVMAPYPAYTQFGFQYAFLAVGPLGLATVEGVNDLARIVSSMRSSLVRWGWLLLPVPFLVAAWADSTRLLYTSQVGVWIVLAVGASVVAIYLSLRIFGPEHPDSSPANPPPKRREVARARTVSMVIVAILLILAAGNFAMSPLNTENFPGSGAAGYSFNYQSSPVYPHMSEVVARIPSNAYVVASDNLFPFVANNPNAYSLLWFPGTPTYFPFNASHLPEDVLLSTSEWFVPGFLSEALANSSVYGLRSFLYSVPFYPGSIYLFQLGYKGPPTVTEVSPYADHQVYCPDRLALGASGVRLPEAGTPCGNIIQSRPAANLSGSGPTIWYGPYVTLLPGNYSVTFLLRGETSGAEPPGSSILVLDASQGGGPYWYYLPISSTQVSPTTWTNVTLHFQLTEPAPNSEFRGYLGGVEVNGVFQPGNISLAEIILDRT